MEANFTVLSGPFRGQTFPIPRGKFVLGRESDCHLVLDNSSVSRHHCALLLDDRTLRIRDLASKNGTYVNRDLTRVGERVLVLGDRVRLGDLVIRVELEAGAASPSAASPETQDINPETIDHASHSPEKTIFDQPTSAGASQQAARDSRLGAVTRSVQTRHRTEQAALILLGQPCYWLAGKFALRLLLRSGPIPSDLGGKARSPVAVCNAGSLSAKGEPIRRLDSRTNRYRRNESFLKIPYQDRSQKSASSQLGKRRVVVIVDGY